MPLRRLPCSLWTVIAMLASAVDAQAQIKPEEVRFDTADKVELKGTFYPAGKGKASCVILVHAIGGNRQQQGWEDLAKRLQKEYAVLAFDLRGHGDSTNVDSTAFWKVSTNMNASHIRNARSNREQISYKDFSKAYYPMLANDLAAAKRFLDKKNNAQECNSSNLFVIGAEDGAAIGALWIATEFSRRRVKKGDFGVVASNTFEGEDIAGAVWLSMPVSLGNVAVGNFVRLPPTVRDKPPMAFFYGDKDSRAASAAQSLLNYIKNQYGVNKNKLTLTVKKEKKTKAAGVELLKGALETVDDIAVYLDKVMDSRGTTVWSEREIDKSPFVVIPPNALQPLGVYLR